MSLVNNLETGSKGARVMRVLGSQMHQTLDVLKICGSMCEMKLLWLSSFLSVAVIEHSDQSSKRKLQGNGSFHLTLSGHSASRKESQQELKQEPKGRTACCPVQHYL